MPTVAPAAEDLLCENCGYNLAYTPIRHACPECGTPVAQSLPQIRHPPAFERLGLGGFFATLTNVLFSPGSFFRSISTEPNPGRQRAFSMTMNAVASLTLVAAMLIHWQTMFGFRWQSRFAVTLILAFLACSVVGLGVMQLLSAFAARLAAWEARLRGSRFPTSLARRGVAYFSPHVVVSVLPMLLLAGGYNLLLTFNLPALLSPISYAYAMCVLAVASAVYLFFTFWRCFKNLLHANTAAVVHAPPGTPTG